MQELLARYFSRIRRGGLLTHDEAVSLSRRVGAGDRRAPRKLIEKNLRLIVGVPRDIAGRGLPFEDLIQDWEVSYIDPSYGASAGADRGLEILLDAGTSLDALEVVPEHRLA